MHGKIYVTTTILPSSSQETFCPVIIGKKVSWLKPPQEAHVKWGSQKLYHGYHMKWKCWVDYACC